MIVEIAPPFPLPEFWSDHARADIVYEFDGQRYYLKQLDRHIVYRTADRDSVAHTLFVPCRAVPNVPQRLLHVKSNYWTPTVYPESVFREQIQGGENGRLAMYACPAARDCLAALFFAQDGTGRFVDYGASNRYSASEAKQTIEFTWDGGRHGIPACADILTCDWQTLLPLCHDVFMQQVWPCMKDPYADYEEFPDEPLRFACGSQEELAYITRCIYHVRYAELEEAEEQAGGFVRYYDITSQYAEAWGEIDVSYDPVGVLPERLYRLALAHNVFQGRTWTYTGYGGDPRRKSYEWEPFCVCVPISPPSAHEQAEALLFLYDWLEGKVTEPERRGLLRLDAPAVNTDGKK